MKQEHGKEKLEQLLHSMAQEAKPDKGFEKMLQHKLKMRFAAKYNKEAHPQSRSFWSSFLRFKLQVSTALVLMIFTSTTIYAYNSDGVTNGHILYPLKRSVEKVEEIFVDSPEEKTDYYNRMAERRIRELDYLGERGEFDEETIIEADKLLSLAEIEVVNITDEISEETEVLSAPTTESVTENAEPLKTKEIAIFTGTPDDSFSKKEIAQQEVRQTRNELMARLETHMEKNPNVGQRMENLEEKFREFDEKFKGEDKEEGKKKIKNIRKIEENIIEMGNPPIVADPVINPIDPVINPVDPLNNPVANTASNPATSDTSASQPNNPPNNQPKNPITPINPGYPIDPDNSIDKDATEIKPEMPVTEIAPTIKGTIIIKDPKPLDPKPLLKIQPKFITPIFDPIIKDQLIK